MFKLDLSPKIQEDPELQSLAWMAGVDVSSGSLRSGSRRLAVAVHGPDPSQGVGSNPSNPSDPSQDVAMALAEAREAGPLVVEADDLIRSFAAVAVAEGLGPKPRPPVELVSSSIIGDRKLEPGEILEFSWWWLEFITRTF